MFSVIIPVHNKREHVVAAIESVLAQTYDAYELILIDDCSTDGSDELLVPYKSDNIKIYKRDTPGPGGYAARNLGVKMARHQWLTFLDADDVWHPNHLETACGLIKKYDQIGFFSFSREKIFEGYKSAFIHPREEKVDQFDILERFSIRDIFHTNAVMVRKQLFTDAGGFPAGQCKRGGDSDLWLRILLNCDSIVVSPCVTSCYSLDNSGVIYGKEKVEKLHPVYKTVIDFINKNPQSEIIKALKRISNRKSVSWLSARKRNGEFKISELNVIFFSSLNLATLRGCLKLMLPRPFAKIKVRVKKKSV